MVCVGAALPPSVTSTIHDLPLAVMLTPSGEASTMRMMVTSGMSILLALPSRATRASSNSALTSVDGMSKASHKAPLRRNAAAGTASGQVNMILVPFSAGTILICTSTGARGGSAACSISGIGGGAGCAASAGFSSGFAASSVLAGSSVGAGAGAASGSEGRLCSANSGAGGSASGCCAGDSAAGGVGGAGGGAAGGSARRRG